MSDIIMDDLQAIRRMLNEQGKILKEVLEVLKKRDFSFVSMYSNDPYHVKKGEDGKYHCISDKTGEVILPPPILDKIYPIKGAGDYQCFKCGKVGVYPHKCECEKDESK